MQIALRGANERMSAGERERTDRRTKRKTRKKSAQAPKTIFCQPIKSLALHFHRKMFRSKSNSLLFYFRLRAADSRRQLFVVGISGARSLLRPARRNL